MRPTPHRCSRRAGWRLTCGVLLALGLAALLSAALTAPAALAVPVHPAQACTPDTPGCPPAPPGGQPGARPVVGGPWPTGAGGRTRCGPGLADRACLDPAATGAGTAHPCTGPGCIPDPTPAPAPGGPAQPGTTTGDTSGTTGVDSGAGSGGDCGITNIDGCVSSAIRSFFEGLARAALNPLLDLIGQTLLTTPTPDSLPRLGELWHNSWQILLAVYALLIVIAGIVVMAHESVQTRTSIKEIVPRVVIGFLAGALSLWVATTAIDLANALARAVLGESVDPDTASDALARLVFGSLGGGLYLIVMALLLAAMLTALLITWVVRVALTVILIAGAPLALMFHALPQTEAVAIWWWRAFGGCLVVQVVQSLALATAIRVLLDPGGRGVFGQVTSDLVNLIVALALTYILVKIPFWVLGSLRVSRYRGLLSTVVRGYLAYQGLRMLGGIRGGGPARPGGGGPGGPPGGPLRLGPRPRTSPDGQSTSARPGASASGGGAHRPPLEAERARGAPATPAAPERPVQGGRRALRGEPGWHTDNGRTIRAGRYAVPPEGLRRAPRPAPAPGPRRAPSAGQQHHGHPTDLPAPQRPPAPKPAPPPPVRRTPPPPEPEFGGWS